VLALKCFSTWSVFDLMRSSMDGTTSSSLYEARLGHDKFGKEVHAYSVAWSDSDIAALQNIATKIIFNSVSQFKRHHASLHKPLGLRINPGVSHSHFDLADPARPYSRLGENRLEDIEKILPLLSGVMFHCQCENDSLESFTTILDRIGERYGAVLERVDWVSLGGGVYFTQEGFPLDAFADTLKTFSNRFDVQVYLEPGETAITQSGFLVTNVLDVVTKNGKNIAIVDAAVETHMLDLLIYRQEAKMDLVPGSYSMTIAGKTCLAGDVFGTYSFPAPLTVGDTVCFSDAAGYTLVKKNWFNGVSMPSIVVRRLDGRVETIKSFSYEDYRDSLS